MELTMHGWGEENVPCPILGAGEVVTISYLVSTNGLLPTLAVTANVMDERTGVISQAGAVDVNMDGVIETFTTMDNVNLAHHLALGQVIYDAGMICFATPQAVIR